MKNMKKEKWKENMEYYHIPHLLLFGLILILTDLCVFTLFCLFTGMTVENVLYRIVQFALTTGTLVLWSVTTFDSIRSRKYFKLTNRNYNRDHHQFKKSFQELVTFFSTCDPHRLDMESLPVEDWHDAEGVILCKIKDQEGNYRLVKRNSKANGNICSFGLPGCGKTTAQACPTALRFQGGVFAISIKGDLLNFVKGKRKNIKVFTPDKTEGSCHYNPLDGLMDMKWTDRRKFSENLSIIICPDEPGENSAFFVNGSRDFLSGIILYLLHLHDTGQRPGDLYFPEIVDYILSTNVFDTTLAIQNCGCSIPGEYTNGYIGSSEKNCAGIWSHLCKQVRPFNSGALRTLFDGKGDCITPDALNHSDVYIDVPQDKFQIYVPAMSIIISNFLQAFMRRTDVSSGEDITPILFLLDEAALLKLDFDLLSSSMASLRSKKVSLFLLMQSLHQLSSIYGESQAHQILDLCQYINVFNCQDPSSRTYFSQLVGKKKVLKNSVSSSTNNGKQTTTNGMNVVEEEVYIFDPADFGNFDRLDENGNIIHHVLVYANGRYVLGETTPCYE